MDAEQKKSFAKNQKIPIADAWALVAMADRINEGKYIKLPELDPETGNIAHRPNRDIIRDQILLGLVNISPADREFGERMAVHFQGLAFNAINGSLGDFDQKIMNMLVAEEIDANLGMAYLACMAARYHREIVKENKQEVMLRIAGTSTHQGSIGQHIRLLVTVLNKYEGKAFPGSVVRATDGTNLYFWSSSKMVDMWPDSPEEFPIVGVIKAHGQDRDNIPETRLTRVKIAM
jgi:hypothetical protein